MARFDELTEVSDLRLGRFDSTAKTVLAEYADAGWRGRLGTRGHAILQAPDGTATASVPPKLDPAPHSAQNSRRPLHQWRRKGDAVAIETVEASASEVIRPREVVCPECGKVCPSRQALAGHRGSHRTATCPECGKVMGRNGLGTHLSYAHHGKVRASRKAPVKAALARKKVVPPEAASVVKAAPAPASTPDGSVVQQITELVGALVAENERLRAELSEVRAWVEMVPIAPR